MEVKNKVAIVTGGIGGIGFATVQCLLSNGAQYVAIFDIAENQTVVNNLKELEQQFDKTRFDYYLCDVTDVQEFVGYYEKVLDSQKYVHILINNAGIREDDYIDLLIDINFKAVVNCTMIAVDKMGKPKGNEGGVVVNVASVAGLINLKEQPLYSATKHAVVSFVESMKAHNKFLGVRIVCICPNRTDTDMIKELKSCKKFEFIDRAASEKFKGDYVQRPESVASAVVQMIEEANAGDIWLSQLDEPPLNVSDGQNLKKIKFTTNL